MAAPAVTHTKTLIAPDSGAEDKVYGSDYVSATSHAIADLSGADKLLGAGEGSAVVDEITLGTGLTMTGTTLSASASVTLDAIAAAAGDQAGIANADNNIRWNWQKTTNSEVAFEFGESAASTGGTGVNQVILKASTAAASTASPFSVTSRGVSVFAVAASTTAQVQFNTATYAAPTLSLLSASNAGFLVATNPGIAVSGVENSRWLAGIYQASYGAGDTASYNINIRKSRGTVASPTVITTGDDLATINALGYVGATNTYQVAGSIICDSTGTISDSATGIGGIWRFNVATVGAEAVEVMNITGNTVNAVQGLSTTLSPVITKANTNTTAVGNVGAGEDDLMTYSLPADSMSAAGKGVHIIAWGTTANNANAKTLKLYFGSTILTNALTGSIAGVWRIEADILSTGTDAQQYCAQLVTTGTAGVALNDIEQGTLTENDGAAITIKCTGEATSDNDIVQEGFIVTFYN